MRTVKIKPVAEETLGARFKSRLQDLEARLRRFSSELLAIERDASAAGFPIEPTALLLARQERATAALKRQLETHASDPLQFALDLPPTAQARDDREADRGLDHASPPR